MKRSSFPLTGLITLVLILAGAGRAAETDKTPKAAKPPALTLEDIIFDVQYLKKFLGPKTLVTAVVETTRDRKKSDTALADTIKAVQDAQLDEKTQIFALPDDATPPELKTSIPHTYPPGLKMTKEPKRADFLILIGADGTVKCLYCYSYTNDDQLFALSAAQAVLKWRYAPAKIGNTAVPVLAGLPMELQSSDVLNILKNRQRMEGGMPTRTLPPPPPPRGTPVSGG